MTEASGEVAGRRADAVRDSDAGTALWAQVYEELRGMARRQMARLAPGDALQATALVHEAYLRLRDRTTAAGFPDNRAHFFYAASRAMRDIVVEEARKCACLKRGGGRARITFDEAIGASKPADENLLALNDALERLEACDRVSSDVVMLRYFAGLTIEETARAMAISPPTVKRHWQYARAWLRSQIVGDQAGEAGGDDGGQ